MSQYPYQQPTNTPYGYGYPPQDPMATLLAPAKRASIFLFILSGVFIPCGGFMLLYHMMISSGSVPPEAAAQVTQIENQAALLGLSLGALLKIFAASMGIPGLVFLILGVVLRKGGIGSAVASLIVSSILCLLSAYFTLGGLAVSAQGHGEAMIMSCMTGVLLVLAIFILVFSVQAVRNAGKVAAFRTGQYAQMQQYQQYSQQYQHPSQQPQSWQQPGGQWPQPTWPPQQPPQQQQQNWPPPPPSNPA